MQTLVNDRYMGHKNALESEGIVFESDLRITTQMNTMQDLYESLHALNSASIYSNPNLTSLSLCSTTIVLTSGSLKIDKSLILLPFKPLPISFIAPLTCNP